MSTASELVELVIVLWVLSGPVVILLLLLNRRDAREAALRTSIADLLVAPELRGTVAVQARYSLWRARARVTLGMPFSRTPEVLRTMSLISARLPRGVTIAVGATSAAYSELGIRVDGGERVILRQN